MLALLLPLVTALLLQEPAPDPLRVVLDGEERTPAVASLDGRPQQPGPRDVVELGRFALRLGDVAGRRLATERADRRTVRLVDAETREVLVCETETLLGLAPEARAALSGLRVERWDEELARALADLDLERVVVTVTDAAAVGEARALPPLPAGLRALVVESNGKQGFGDWSALARLTGLLFLRLDGRRNIYTGLELAQLRGLRELRHLDLGRHEADGDDLPALPQLRQLVAQDGLEVDSLAFVERLPRLRWLELTDVGLRAADLREPARELVHLDLSFNADLNAFRGERFPRLEHLDLGATAVPRTVVRALRDDRPECFVVAAPDQATLDAAVARCDRLVVRSGGTCHLEGDEEVLVDERDPSEVARVLRWLAIEEQDGEFACMCCGEPTLLLYEGEERIAAIGLHHGRSVRWKGGPWSSDASLARRVREPLARWLDARGVSGPLEELLGD